MIQNYAVAFGGTTPRPLDKCAAVRAFPVPLQ
jgi:hypothetical protein